MRESLEQLLRAADVPSPEWAEVLWAEYRTGGPGAEAAFTTLLAWYGLVIYRRIWGFVRSDAAEDVFQDVLAKLHRRRQKLATFEHALRWLRTVAVRDCVDAHRRATRRNTRERRARRPEGEAPPGERIELQEVLAVALSKLSREHREAVALVFFEGLDKQDAAKVLGINRDTLADRLTVALSRLQKLMPAPAVLAVGGSVAVPAALSAQPPLPPTTRLSELAKAAWAKATRSAPRLWKVVAIVVGLAGIGGVTLAAWPPSEPGAAPPPDLAARPAPEAATETLQAKNLRILEADVLPPLLARLEKLLAMPVRVTRTRAEGAEVFVYVEGTRPWLGGKVPPRFRVRYDVLGRVLVVMADWGGSRGWEYVNRRTPARLRVFGKEYTFEIDATSLGLREAFDRLPRDDRATGEFARHRLTNTPYGGTELLVPYSSGELAGNSRYLYLPSWGHLLVRDARGGFVGWRWAGTTAGHWMLAADDDHLFGATDLDPVGGPVASDPDGWRLYVRPATAEPAEWVALGPMPARFGADAKRPARTDKWVGIAAAGGWVFADSTVGTLSARPAVAGPESWRSAGTRPAGRGKLLGHGDWLYYLGEDGRLWSRPAGQFNAEWHLVGEVGRFVTATIWAGRLVCWNMPPEGNRVLARPIGPSLGEWTPIGRVDPGESFLGHEW
jgi:RNA polymerase sigma factor (sigma-70 family)